MTQRHDAAALANKLPAGVLEIPDLFMIPASTSSFTIEARVISPRASDIVSSRLPPLLKVDHPFVIEFTMQECGVGAQFASSVARCLSSHAEISLIIEAGPSSTLFLAPISARPSDRGWIAHAIIHPTSWTDAACVTVVSLSLAGRFLPCDCLPTTLRVGYNHAPAPAGAVYRAAKACDVLALQAALDAGGSSEEADDSDSEASGCPGGHNDTASWRR